MKIKLFEATGLNEVEYFLFNNKSNINKKDFEDLMGTVNLSFSLENCNRLLSTILCELGYSYVQQSQRYVELSKEGWSLLANLIQYPELFEEGSVLVDRSFELYNRMSEKRDDIKNGGRPKLEDYKHGIPIEDARYILPLAANTNICMTATGSDFLSIIPLLNHLLGDDLKKELENVLPRKVLFYMKTLYHNEKEFENNSLIDQFNKEKFNQITQEKNVVLFNTFKDPIVRTGIGALTSTKKITPSQVVEEWGENLVEKATGVTKRVLGYNHTSIIEQQRTSFGLMMSFVTYHQFIRHRLAKNIRETLHVMLEDYYREVVIPPTIKNSQFNEEYLELAKDYADFRKKLVSVGLKDEALEFLLNCNQIKVITSTNARIDCEIIVERACMNAQWEIRDLYLKKLRELKIISPIIYANALPHCMRGGCKEGKLSCGQPEVIKSILEA